MSSATKTTHGEGEEKLAMVEYMSAAQQQKHKITSERFKSSCRNFIQHLLQTFVQVSPPLRLSPELLVFCFIGALLVLGLFSHLLLPAIVVRLLLAEFCTLIQSQRGCSTVQRLLKIDRNLLFGSIGFLESMSGLRSN